MAEREQTLKFLIEEVGVSAEEAERRMRDEDLWLVPPYMRDGLPDTEKTVEEWEYALGFAKWLSEHNPVLNAAAWTLVCDMRERAEEALRRARQRLRESQQST